MQFSKHFRGRALDPLSAGGVVGYSIPPPPQAKWTQELRLVRAPPKLITALLVNQILNLLCSVDIVQALPTPVNCTRVRILYLNLHHLLLHLIAHPQRSSSSQKRSWCTVTQQWINCLQNLTHLDVSENNIESLDLSALEKLENLQCSKNQLLELTLNGTVLLSVIAGNNRKLNNPLTCNDEEIVVILESHSLPQYPSSLDLM